MVDFTLAWVGPWIVFMSFMLWWSVCTQRAYVQREAIRAYVMAMPGSGADWHAALRAYQTVSYHKHIWALMCLKDPRHIYNQVLAPAFPPKRGK